MAGNKKYNSDGQSAEERALDQFAKIMIDKISSIKEDWKKPWFTEGFMAWPKNLSGRKYNGMNALMLMFHCERRGFQLPVFCTFQRVAGLNYSTDKHGNHRPLVDDKGEKLPQVSVLKGEKSFPVFITTFTVVDKETKEKIKIEDYRNLSSKEQEKYAVYPKLNVHNVFNVDQTNLREARPQLYEKLQEENQVKRSNSLDGEKMSFAPLDEMIAQKLWVCPIYTKHQDNAYYSISKDEIVVPEKSQFVDGESFYGTLLHEMTHSTGAESRLNRIKPAAFGSKDYAREELVAELGSALVASQYGMNKHIKEDSAAYLKSWLESLKETPEFLKTTLFDVKKASSMIVQRIDEVAEKIEAKARPFYCSVAFLQMPDDTQLFDRLQETGDYKRILQEGREYDQGDAPDLKFTYRSACQHRGDDILDEDEHYAVVYNPTVGGTYDIMRKIPEQEIRDNIVRYGLPDDASEDVKTVAKDMVAEEFLSTVRERMPVFEMPIGDTLYISYNRLSDTLDVGTVTNGGFTASHSFAYDHDKDLTSNLQDVRTALEEMPEYQYRDDAAGERVNPQIDLMDADNDGNTQEVAHEEKESEDVAAEEYVPYRRGR